MEKISSIVLLGAGCFSTSCQIASSVMTGESIQRVRVVNEEGDPLAAAIYPGVPVPFAERFNRTDKNGFFLVQPGDHSITVASGGYFSYECSTSDVPKTVVLKRAPEANNAALARQIPPSVD